MPDYGECDICGGKREAGYHAYIELYTVGCVKGIDKKRNLKICRRCVDELNYMTTKRGNYGRREQN
jgi:hypothetical protein